MSKRSKTAGHCYINALGFKNIIKFSGFKQSLFPDKEIFNIVFCLIEDAAKFTSFFFGNGAQSLNFLSENAFFP